jgi:excisionase family DNA binding protein
MASLEKEILERLDRIEAHLAVQGEEFLTFEQGSEYLGFSTSYLYKLTSQNIIPFYRPSGKKIRFKRSELDAWIGGNRISSVSELEKDDRVAVSLSRRTLRGRRIKIGSLAKVST